MRRDKAPGKARTARGRKGRWEEPGRHTDAWCRKPSSRSRDTREFRTRSRAGNPARAWLRGAFEIRRVEEFPDCERARWQPSEAREQSSRADINRGGERSGSGARRKGARAARHFFGFVARGKDSKSGSGFWLLASSG